MSLAANASSLHAIVASLCVLKIHARSRRVAPRISAAKTCLLASFKPGPVGPHLGKAAGPGKGPALQPREVLFYARRLASTCSWLPRSGA